ncbi:MAG: IS4 family transposase, partial [Planctomycetaceae bacterium]|nr:IS4 family transposase [Planctomycetaceae bacterium]
VAWRILYIARLGRSCPDIDCEAVFDVAEWKSVYRVTYPEKPLPQKTPTLKEMINLVAQLGGYVAHAKDDKPPGVETIWKGIQRTKDRAWAWETFGPEKNSS